MILGDFYQNLKKRVDALDARLLLCHALKLSQEEFLVQKDRALSDDEIAAVETLIAQREKGCPVAKIIGKREFYGRDFITTEDTLDPRPDSETLIEVVKNKIMAFGLGPEAQETWVPGTSPRIGSLKILDLGTGTGCLLLTLLCEIKDASGVAVDLSEKALEVARRNAENLGVESRVSFVRGSWFENVTGEFDVVVSNPPYIPSDKMDLLDRDVRDFEPHSALNGGADGLDAYRAILAGVAAPLKPGGLIAFEVGCDQAEAVMEMLKKSGFERVERHRDLAGINRIVTGFRL